MGISLVRASLFILATSRPAAGMEKGKPPLVSTIFWEHMLGAAATDAARPTPLQMFCSAVACKPLL